MLTLVLLPGLDATGRLFADFAAALGPQVEVIVASYPGDIPLGYAGLEPVARSFLPQDRPFFLLAESFSGPLAIAIAASPPPGLRGVALCCSFARPPLPWLAPARFALGFFPIAALPTALLAFFVLGPFATPERRSALAQSLALVAPRVLRTRAQAALSIDVTPLLSHIAVPVLYLRASNDRIVPRASFEHIRHHVPHTKVVEFPAPHFLLQVMPKPAAATLLEFMGRCHG